MIKHLLELKLVFIGMANPHVLLSDMVWGQVENLKNLLYQLYIVTKKVQSEDLTPGQFFKQLKGSFADVYLDSMYSCLLTDEQKIKEKNATCDIAVKIKKPEPDITALTKVESISSSTNIFGQRA